MIKRLALTLVCAALPVAGQCQSIEAPQLDAKIVASAAALISFKNECMAGQQSSKSSMEQQRIWCIARDSDAQKGIEFASSLSSGDGSDTDTSRGQRFIAIKLFAEGVFDDCVLRRSSIGGSADDLRMTISICSVAKNDAYRGIELFQKHFKKS